MSSPDTVVVHSLGRGQAMQLSLRTGSRLVCLEGSLEMSFPLQCLGGSPVGMGLALGQGEQWSAAAAGGLVLRAGPRGARLLCMVPAPAGTAGRMLASWWRRLADLVGGRPELTHM